MVASQPFFNLIKLTFSRVYPSLKPHISFYSNHLQTGTVFPILPILKSIIAQVGHFEIDQVDIVQGILFYGNARYQAHQRQ